MRRQQLSEDEIVALFDPPTDQRELVRHYTLSDADITAIRRCRGDHNRLGHALMLCYLRYPGRPLHPGERPPEPLLAFVAEQLDVLPESIDEYLAVEPGFAVARQTAEISAIFQRLVADGFRACVYAVAAACGGSSTARSCLGADTPRFFSIEASSAGIFVR